ncbi:Puromycin-sensitive aminopeptidase and related aminopeptidases [Phaffia rhodozyma]|uniref:Puromycin-sensitive aminopeptidase and related aminopeptidases n=1 Tax=Phaffia rhodozyma TaxID=264483 RepID=A0A0F7SL58_PHARH|nr:Puromycin-sensitive aminopeptidase and related aminopeptidases [Phaffia rhodozyma]
MTRLIPTWASISRILNVHSNLVVTTVHVIKRSYSTMNPAITDAFRLPTNVKPLHYDIILKTSLRDRSFEGSSSILLKVQDASDKRLIFNAHSSLHIHSLHIESFAAKTEAVYNIPDSAVKRDDKNEQVVVDIAALQGFNWRNGDEIKLNLGWGAELGQSMIGYYISTYIDKDTKQEAIYTLTQFEATDARKAMPCWDEPEMKASFSVTMISQADTVNLSNMPVTIERPWVEGQSEGVFDRLESKTYGKLISGQSKTQGKTQGATEGQTKTDQTPLGKTEGDVGKTVGKTTSAKTEGDLGVGKTVGKTTMAKTEGDLGVGKTTGKTIMAKTEGDLRLGKTEGNLIGKTTTTSSVGKTEDSNLVGKTYGKTTAGKTEGDQGKTIGKTTAGKTEGDVAAKTTGKTIDKTHQKAANVGWKITKFEKSPLMSTYLLAFANGYFEYRKDSYISPLTGKTVPLRIYATSDIIHQVDYALEITKRATPLYEEIFDIPYALPKLDSLVATDFDAQAMENYGLILGRTSVLLLDKKSGLAAKKQVASVQSHEIAHQWFGNYVTMKWWSELWLNEAFATLCGEVIIPDRLYPEWNVRSVFITDHLFRAFDLDAQRSSHPIQVEFEDANKISQFFDAISYSKGASVLRMIAGIVGEDKFLRGVSVYLKTHAYSNATTQDLWKAIQEASGVDIPKIADAWIQKIGHPLVTATEKDGKLHMQQNRFLATGNVQPEEDETIWHIPLRLILIKDGKAEIKKDLVLSEREITIDLEGATVYKLNADTTGFYRVAYSSSHLDVLGKESSKQGSVFSPEDRVGLVADAYKLARAGYSSTTGMLDLISHFKNEEKKVVWSIVADALSDLSSVWWEQPEDVRNSIKDLTRTIFAPLIDRLRFEFIEDEDPDIKELRTLAFSQAGIAGYEPVIKFATEAFRKFASGDENAIAPDIQRAIFRLAIIHLGEEAYDIVKEVYKNPSNPSTKVDAMVALTAPTDNALLGRTFSMLITEVKDQDVLFFFMGLAQNTKSRRALVDYFQTNYDAIYKRFNNTMSLNRLVGITYNKLSTRADLDSIQSFFAGKDTSQFDMSLAQTSEAVLASTQWLSTDKENVESWLKAKK